MEALKAHRRRVAAKKQRIAVRQAQKRERTHDYETKQRAELTRRYHPQLLNIPSHGNEQGLAYTGPHGSVTGDLAKLGSHTLSALLHVTGHSPEQDVNRVFHPSATQRAIAHPRQLVKGLSHLSRDRYLAASVPGYKPHSFPQVSVPKAAYAVGVVANEARKGNLHPLGKTLRDIGIYTATAPAGVVQALADPVGTAREYTKDANRRYSGSYKQVERRVKKQGAGAEAADLLTLGTPAAAGAGRGITTAAREFAPNSRAARFLTEHRPDLRVSGNASKRQELSPNAFRAVAQRGEDRARAARVRKRTARAAKQGRPAPGLQPRSAEQVRQDALYNRRTAGARHRRALRAGDSMSVEQSRRDLVTAKRQQARAKARRQGARAEVVPLFEKRAERIVQAEVQSRHHQRFKARRQQEITGSQGSALANISHLNRHERLAVTLAIKGAMPLDKEHAVPWLHNVREAMHREYQATQREGTGQALKAIDDLIAHSDRAFTPKLRQFQAEEVARTQRISSTDRELRATTAQAQPRRAQAFALEAQGIDVPQHPHEALMAQFEPKGPRHQAAVAARATERRTRTVVTRKVRQARQELDASRRELSNARAAEKYRQGRTELLVGRSDRTRPVDHPEAGTRPRRSLAGLERAGGRTLEARVRVKRAENRLREAERQGREQLRTVRATRIEAERATGRKAKAEAQASKPEHDAAFAAAIDEIARSHGLPSPGYIKDYKHRAQVEGKSPAAIGGEHAAPGLKRSELALFKTGRADLSPQAHLQSLSEQVKRQANHDMIEESANLHALPPPSKQEMRAALGHEKDDLTADDWRQILAHRGQDTADWAVWQPGRFQDALDSAASDAAGRGGETAAEAEGVTQSAVRAGFQESLKTADNARVGGTYVIPREVYREIADRKSGLTGRALDKFMGAQAGLLLGLSPKWAQFQIGANAFLSGFGVRGNLTAFVTAKRDWERAFTPEVRAYAHEMFGTGVGRAHANQRVQLGAAIDDTGLLGWGRAWREAAGIRYRYRKNQIPGVRNIEGNPLFQLDAAQNEFFKKAVFTSEIKRLYWHQITRDAGHLNAALQRIDHLLRGASADQLKEFSRDPEILDSALRHTDAVLGNYVRYTAKERAGIRRVVLFYGFMRYALRTAFYTAPVHHPIIGSIVLKLSQLHKQEVDELFGGHALPWTYGRIFFSGHSPLSLLKVGQKVPGKADLYSIDLGRLSPTQSPITDVGTEGPKALFSTVLSPLAQSIANTYAYGEDLFTGQKLRYGGSTQDRPLTWGARNRIFLNDALTTATPFREFERITQPEKTTPDTLPWDPKPVKYKTPEKQAEQERRTRAARRRGIQGDILSAIFAPYPQLDTSRDTIRTAQQAKRKGGSSGSGSILDELQSHRQNSAGQGLMDELQKLRGR
jgi:hypothetical protein